MYPMLSKIIFWHNFPNISLKKSEIKKFRDRAYVVLMPMGNFSANQKWEIMARIQDQPIKQLMGNFYPTVFVYFSNFFTFFQTWWIKMKAGRKIRILISGIVIHIIVFLQMTSTSVTASILQNSKLVSSLLTSSAIPPKP